MPTLFRTIALYAWALWIGGLMTLFLSVQTIFKTDRSIAVQAAPMLFHAFERYQLVLAGVAIVSGAALWSMSRTKSILVAIILFALAGALGGVEMTQIAPEMNSLQKAGQLSNPEFKRLHGISMMMYTGEAALLLIAGVLMIPKSSSKPRQT